MTADRISAGGFDMRLKTGRLQFLCERKAIMHQRFASCHDSNSGWKFFCLYYHVRHRSQGMSRSIPAFLHIAPDASDIAAAQADKIGCFALVKTLALDGIKRFHQWQ